jgi:hypothetical protein
MKISELIRELEQVLAAEGDLPVYYGCDQCEPTVESVRVAPKEHIKESYGRPMYPEAWYWRERRVILEDES